MLPADSELGTIQLVLQGNSAAYATLVDRYQAYVFTLVMKYVDSREVAEELAQDVFVKAYKSLADFKGASKFSTWLYSITHNTCVSYVRKKPAPSFYPGQDTVQALADLSQNGETALQRMENRARQKYVEAAIKQLAPVDAEIVTLFYLAGQSVEETGRAVGLTANNVKVRLFRARNRLRELLEDIR